MLQENEMLFLTSQEDSFLEKKSQVTQVLVAQSCPTLCDPMDCSPPGSSVHGIFQARILEWVAISFSRGFFQPRDRARVSCMQAGSLPSEPPGKLKGPSLLLEWQSHTRKAVSVSLKKRHFAL